jgi:hypothetical protein
MWLPLIMATMGTYLMNGYSVLKECPAPHSEKQVEGLSLHLFPHLEAVFQPCWSKNFLIVFFCRVYGLRHSLKRASFHRCDLFIGQFSKVVKH